MLENIKKNFPVFQKNPKLIFLDTAASALKPESVVKTISDCYSYEYANVHRGVYSLSSNLTKRFEEVRSKVSQFISAESKDNIVFTKSATEGINLVADSFSQKFLGTGDEIILSYLEHHANIVPWQIAAKKYGFKIIVSEITEDGSINTQDVINKINTKTKFIALTHMSNVTGSITSFEEIVDKAKKNNASLLIDGCQHIAHKPVNVQNLGCDFYVFSGHKLYGPSGVGVLYMKQKWFDQLDPYQGGGSMIDKVDFKLTTYAKGYQKFEAGTPPIVPVVGLGTSIEFLNQYDLNEIFEYEKNLYEYMEDKIKSLNDIEIYGQSKNKGSILTFNIKNIHASDIALILDQHDIAIRTGHHCAQPLMKKLQVTSTARASFGIYNNKNDVDCFVESLKESKKFLN